MEINQQNFEQYFKDCRRSRPERDDVIARFTAIAEFTDGRMKLDIIDLLTNRDKALAATQVMRKLGCATERDSIRICKEICQDLISGMSALEVEKKPYEYVMEAFYYTKKEYVPLQDSHWSIISIDNLDEFLDADKNRIKMTTKIVEK